MDNFLVIYRILQYLEKAMDYDEADTDYISAEYLGLTEQRWLSIMEMLTKEGYIAGFIVERSADGEVCLSFTDIRITLKGLEYLQENSLMRKAADVAKLITETIS